jgi:hypothetical protein
MHVKTYADVDVPGGRAALNWVDYLVNAALPHGPYTAVRQCGFSRFRADDAGLRPHRTSRYRVWANRVHDRRHRDEPRSSFIGRPGGRRFAAGHDIPPASAIGYVIGPSCGQCPLHPRLYSRGEAVYLGRAACAAAFRRARQEPSPPESSSPRAPWADGDTDTALCRPPS